MAALLCPCLRPELRDSVLSTPCPQRPGRCLSRSCHRQHLWKDEGSPSLWAWEGKWLPPHLPLPHPGSSQLQTRPASGPVGASPLTLVSRRLPCPPSAASLRLPPAGLGTRKQTGRSPSPPGAWVESGEVGRRRGWTAQQGHTGRSPWLAGGGGQQVYFQPKG